MDDNKEEGIDPFFMAEFCCWTMVALAPVLTWVNGPAVSTDQFVVRTAVFALALTGGVCLRVTNIVRKRRGETLGLNMSDQVAQGGYPPQAPSDPDVHD
ncbi:MAG: hypothetical protein HQ582_08095 [Planctomycetes bacterium]|nr:hypothetical protein [Planctomycetota bacterium]